MWLRLRLVFSLSRCFLFLVSVGFGRNSDWAFVCGGGCRGSRILGFFFLGVIGGGEKRRGRGGRGGGGGGVHWMVSIRAAPR